MIGAPHDSNLDAQPCHTTVENGKDIKGIRKKHQHTDLPCTNRQMPCNWLFNNSEKLFWTICSTNAQLLEQLH
jgi:hypothetical protein